MDTRTAVRRELYVAAHAQTRRFRAVKYVVLFLIGWAVHVWGGWPAVGKTFAVLLAVALGVHFLFRWKTKAWTQPWGPYRPLKGLPER